MKAPAKYPMVNQIKEAKAIAENRRELVPDFYAVKLLDALIATEVERDHYKKALTILDTWEFSGRMGKQEMKKLIHRVLQEAGDE